MINFYPQENAKTLKMYGCELNDAGGVVTTEPFGTKLVP